MSWKKSEIKITKNMGAAQMLRAIERRIDNASGSPHFTAEDHDKIEALADELETVTVLPTFEELERIIRGS